MKFSSNSVNNFMAAKHREIVNEFKHREKANEFFDFSTQ
jgi:hypothetical protein